MTHIAAIINPIAGRGRGLRAWQATRPLVNRAGTEIRESFAGRPGEAWDMARQATADHADLIVTVGGDGTLHEVVNGVMRGRPDHPPALAVIPGGTANIFAHAVGLPKDPAQAAQGVLTGIRRPIDLGQANDRYFITVAGTGLDAEVVARVNRWRHGSSRTKLLYALVTLRMLPICQAVDARITIDGVEQHTDLVFLAAANTAWYGGGLHIAPHARVDSGVLAVVAATNLGRLQTAGLLARIFFGDHLRHPNVIHGSAREVRVQTAVPLAVHADGETIGQTPVTFRVIPHALELMMPA